MKVLVTGKNGKFVTYFREYAAKSRPEWCFDYISLRGDAWKNSDWSGYDAILHCAGATSVENDDYDAFYRINVELTDALFAEALRQHVKHFVFLSSMAVYDGVGWGFGEEGLITADTQPKQKSNYGRSKFEAEEAIRRGDGDIKTAIVRAPSIVGASLEAYFSRYIRFSELPLIPIPWIHTEAKRSIVYIDTLIDFILDLIERTGEGVFFPQNLPQLSVSEMMLAVCEERGKKKRKSILLGKMLPQPVQKRFFSQICYDVSLSRAENERNSQISGRKAIGLVMKGQTEV